MKTYKEFLSEGRGKAKRKMPFRLKDSQGKSVTLGFYKTKDGTNVEVINWKKGNYAMIVGGKTVNLTYDSDEIYAGMVPVTKFIYKNGKQVSIGDTYTDGFGNTFTVSKISGDKITSKLGDKELRAVTSKAFNKSQYKKQ